jgi:hypothetical protein
LTQENFHADEALYAEEKIVAMYSNATGEEKRVSASSLHLFTASIPY